jgi:hypothetical protein
MAIVLTLAERNELRWMSNGDVIDKYRLGRFGARSLTMVRDLRRYGQTPPPDMRDEHEDRA